MVVLASFLPKARLTVLCRCLSTQTNRVETLVSAEWLNKKLLDQKTDSLKVLHSSYDDCQDYDRMHIPGALCFDGKYCRDKASPYANMLPDKDQFQNYMRELGVENDSHVVVYDASTVPIVNASARVWYMLRLFGHAQVSLLNGGLLHWLLNGYPTTTEETRPAKQSAYNASFRPELVKSYEEVVENVKAKQYQLVDARSSERFRNLVKETKGEPGRVPGSLNLPAQSLVDPKTKLMKDPAGLREALRAADVDLNAPLISTCGTGMTACALLVVAHLLEGKDQPLYDGSWFEYSRRSPPELIEKEK